jgi:hypothetical protein
MKTLSLVGAALLSLAWGHSAMAADLDHYFDGGQRRALTRVPDLVATVRAPSTDRQAPLAGAEPGAWVAGDSRLRIERLAPMGGARAAASASRPGQSPVWREGTSPAGRLMAAPGGVLVKVPPEWSSAQARDWLAAHGHVEAMPLGLGAGWWRVPTAPGEAALAAANRLHDTGELLAASPDWWREARTR